MPTFDIFGMIAPWYERLIQPVDRYKVGKRFGLPISGRILDIGGGTGRVAGTMTSSASQVVIADESLGMLRQASTKAGLRVVCCSGEHLPFTVDQFERVIMVDVYHHLQDQEKVLEESWRVLTPQGKIIIEEPDIEFSGVVFISIVEKFLKMRSNFVSPKVIGEKLKRNNNARINIQKEGNTAWITADLPR